MTFSIVLVVLPAVWQHRCYSQPDMGHAAVPQPPPVIPSASDLLIVLVAVDPHNRPLCPQLSSRGPQAEGSAFSLPFPIAHRAC